MSIHKLFKKKKRQGFAEKPEKLRTRDEIDREYHHHAMMYGHISRVMFQNQKLLDEHLAALERLNEEGMKLPKEEPKAEEKKPEEPKPA